MENNIIPPNLEQDYSHSEPSDISYYKSQNGNMSFQKSISLKCDKENNTKNLNNKKIICKRCKYFPKVYLNDDLYSINLICDCREYDNMETDYFMENYVIEKEEDNFNNYSKKIKLDSYCSCDKHLGKKYAYYCIPCDENLCNECYTEIDRHSKHKVINYKGNELINKINEINKKLESDNKNIFENFSETIREILEVYDNYPSYSGSICINNIHNYLMKNISNDDKYRIHKQMKEYYRVKLEKEIKQLLEQQKEAIIRTIRINKKNFYCLDILSNINFKSLRQLELSNNNIEDLTPLLYSKFPVLDSLNLSCNKINDENANKIFKFDMPNLSFLNLYQNDLTKFDFFKGIHIFKKLKILYVGFNQFDEEISDIDENTVYDCSTIEIIGFTKGMFSDKSIDLISKFHFENLNTLYLRNNNLTSLSFLDKMKCK